MKIKFQLSPCLIFFVFFIVTGCGGPDNHLRHEPEIKARSFGSFRNFFSFSFQGFINAPSTAMAFIRLDGKFREKIMLTETITNNSAA